MYLFLGLEGPKDKLLTTPVLPFVNTIRWPCPYPPESRVYMLSTVSFGLGRHVRSNGCSFTSYKAYTHPTIPRPEFLPTFLVHQTLLFSSSTTWSVAFGLELSF